MPPNGSRLSCGRLARRRKGPAPSAEIRQARQRPASLKRLLGQEEHVGEGGTTESEMSHKSPPVRPPLKAEQRRVLRLLWPTSAVPPVEHEGARIVLDDLPDDRSE